MEVSAPPRRALELYSGLGGLHQALAAVCPAATVCPIEINSVANAVYRHNFRQPVLERDIRTLTTTDVVGLGCDAWLLSPPCQPHTRQGLRRDEQDPRSESFLHVLSLLEGLDPSSLPRFLLLENVAGFEASETHRRACGVLLSRGFQIQEFLLTPRQLGVPYQRLRFFLLARLSPPTPRAGLGPGDTSESSLEEAPRPAQGDTAGSSWDGTVNPVVCHSPPAWPAQDSSESPPTLADFLGSCSSAELWERHQVPLSVLEKGSSMAFDIVYPHSRSCCCFTKAYGRFARGTGSVLQTARADTVIPEGPHHLHLLKLRYFSPMEVARLHGFRPDYEFPPEVTVRQCYGLLGNSLSVTVATQLLKYLFGCSEHQS
eukprot:RCo011320